MHSRTLYRSRKNKMIGGVCGGLAEYFNVDVTLVRIVFVLLAFSKGIGILFYLFLLIVMPRESAEHASDTHPTESAPVETPQSSEDNRAPKRRSGRQIIGLFVVLIGMVALINTLLPDFINWSIFWPAMLIVFGLFLIFYKRKGA